MLHLAKNLRLIRLLSGKTQTEFGQMFGASKAMIISYESGKASPNDLFIERIARYAGISETDLQNKTLSEKSVGVGKVEKVDILPQVEEPTPAYDNLTRLINNNESLARSMEIMANLLQEKEATMKEIKASLAQIPEDMYALSAKLLEGQQHIYDLVGQVKNEVKKPHGKAPVPVKKR